MFKWSTWLTGLSFASEPSLRPIVRTPGSDEHFDTKLLSRSLQMSHLNISWFLEYYSSNSQNSQLLDDSDACWANAYIYYATILEGISDVFLKPLNPMSNGIMEGLCNFR